MERESALSTSPGPNVTASVFISYCLIPCNATRLDLPPRCRLGSHTVRYHPLTYLSLYITPSTLRKDTLQHTMISNHLCLRSCPARHKPRESGSLCLYGYESRACQSVKSGNITQGEQGNKHRPRTSDPSLSELPRYHAILHSSASPIAGDSELDTKMHVPQLSHSIKTTLAYKKPGCKIMSQEFQRSCHSRPRFEPDCRDNKWCRSHRYVAIFNNDWRKKHAKCRQRHFVRP